jgi:hypothetical protein
MLDLSLANLPQAHRQRGRRTGGERLGMVAMRPVKVPAATA